MYDAMSEIPVILFQLSVSLVALTAKANQGGIVQQQIETMGLRQAVIGLGMVGRNGLFRSRTLRDFGGAVFRQKPVIAAPTTPLYLI
jgi:hypothetical protein